MAISFTLPRSKEESDGQITGKQAIAKGIGAKLLYVGSENTEGQFGGISHFLQPSWSSPLLRGTFLKHCRHFWGRDKEHKFNLL